MVITQGMTCKIRGLTRRNDFWPNNSEIVKERDRERGRQTRRYTVCVRE